jgi:hypothetical protein
MPFKTTPANIKTGEIDQSRGRSTNFEDQKVPLTNRRGLAPLLGK